MAFPAAHVACQGCPPTSRPTHQPAKNTPPHTDHRQQRARHPPTFVEDVDGGARTRGRPPVIPTRRQCAARDHDWPGSAGRCCDTCHGKRRTPCTGGTATFTLTFLP